MPIHNYPKDLPRNSDDLRKSGIDRYQKNPNGEKIKGSFIYFGNSLPYDCRGCIHYQTDEKNRMFCSNIDCVSALKHYTWQNKKRTTSLEKK